MISAPGLLGPVSDVRPSSVVRTAHTGGHWTGVRCPGPAQGRELGIMAGHYSRFLDSIQFSFCRGSSFVFPLVWNTNGCTINDVMPRQLYQSTLHRCWCLKRASPTTRLNGIVMELECCHSNITQPPSYCTN